MISSPIITKLNDVPVGSIITFPQYDGDQLYIVLEHKMTNLAPWLPADEGEYHRIEYVNCNGIISHRTFSEDSALQVQFDSLWRIIALPQ